MRTQPFRRFASTLGVIVSSMLLMGCPEDAGDSTKPLVPVPAALTLRTAGGGTGTVVASPAAAAYLPGTQVTITAAAAAGSVFTGWSGDCSVRAVVCPITMDIAKSVTGTFGIATGLAQYDGAFGGGHTGGTSNGERQPARGSR